ncbi:hypothetical protein [Paenibacillus protaetiae]|uniref:Uncharacterized protein n=1 Tax=Paenibacillus protaetiae TaxID=2509456 RepID=A0A4P6EX37_9BACL|nr:hypothetical protein [Paenibacillus protaetiae]QAY67614.1 hypothetical protein ET464_15720 [Paenibacillus protaetiae]
MSEEWNEQELMDYIKKETELAEAAIRLVLKHEQAFMGKAKENAHGEVEIDSDELVDYIMSRSDVKLNELEVESVLDAEMDFFMDKGMAGYID